MIPFILALASFNISNTQDYMVMRFECKKTEVVQGTIPITPCEYEFLVIVDDEGKEHRYRLADVKNQAIKELKNLEIKKTTDK